MTSTRVRPKESAPATSRWRLRSRSPRRVTAGAAGAQAAAVQQRPRLVPASLPAIRVQGERGFGIRDSGCDVLDLRLDVRDSGFDVRDSRLGVPALGFEARDSQIVSLHSVWPARE